MIFGRSKKPEDTQPEKVQPENTSAENIQAGKPPIPQVSTPAPAQQPPIPVQQLGQQLDQQPVQPAVAATPAPVPSPAVTPQAFAPQASAQPPGGAPAAPAESAAPTAQASEEQARRAMGAKMIAASFGEIVNVLMRSNTYKHFSLADLEWLVVPPVLSQQFVLAEARNNESGVPTPIAVALWASVSPEVDQKLAANTTGPLRLRPDQWKSGEILWLIDAVGPPQVLNGLIENLHKTVFKGRPLKLRARDEEGKPVIKIQQLPVDEGGAATS